MLDPIVFNDEELEQIRIKIGSEGFESKSWQDDDIKNLKIAIRNHYLEKQDFTCPYCKQVFRSKNARYWDIEHVISRSLVSSFMFEPLNLCMACVDCNVAKSNKSITRSRAKKHYPKKSGSYTIVHPHLDNYEDHIIVIREGFYYVAKRPKGEATISICRLNRFYEYAGFGKEVDGDERIALLSAQLENSGENSRKTLLKEIAELAIKGIG